LFFETNKGVLTAEDRNLRVGFSHSNCFSTSHLLLLPALQSFLSYFRHSLLCVVIKRGSLHRRQNLPIPPEARFEKIAMGVGSEPSPQRISDMPGDIDLEKDVEMSNMAPLIEPEPGKTQEGPKRPRGTMATVIDFACILLNIVSTVLLVFINKWYCPVLSSLTGTLLTFLLVGFSTTIS
jgi:hypothetical protein